MRQGFFQADIENRGIVLDPRTKLLLLLAMSVFVLGGLGGERFSIAVHILCAAPLLLLLTAKKIKAAVLYTGLYSVMYGAVYFLMPGASGIVYFLILGTAGIITRFMPSIMMGVYVVSTTTVSEFTAAMLRMRMSEKLIIPLSVMFRFFPTVADEFVSINEAMRMRGVAFGGKNAGKMLEYRIVPLLTCTTKIGEELSAAALTRGLGGSVRRTNVCEIGFHIQDFVVITACIVPFIYIALYGPGLM